MRHSNGKIKHLADLKYGNGLRTPMPPDIQPAGAATAARRSTDTRRLSVSRLLNTAIGTGCRSTGRIPHAYTLDARLRFLDECFEQARGLLREVTEPREFLQLILAVAILIDKHRLELGEVTDRVAVDAYDSRDRLARLMAKISQTRPGRRHPASH